MNNNPAVPKSKAHALSLSGRNTLSISGVEEVISFDDANVMLRTSEGELAVEGDGLHIVKLNLESGEVAVTGKIVAMVYSEQRERERGGFFSRIVK